MQRQPLQGKAAVVTGGASGIGKAITETLVAHGAKVVVADINPEAGHALARELNKSDKSALFEFCDVTKPEQIARAIATGVNLEKAFQYPFQLSSHVWRKVVEINLVAVLEGTQIAVKEMRGKGGVVINTASMGGVLPMMDTPIYGATKAGVVHFTRSLEHLHELEKIRVNAVCPSFTLTPMVKVQGTDVIETMKHLVGGILQPEDIAAGVLEMVLDETKAGAIMRVTVRHGRDYWRASKGTGPVQKAAL